MKGWNVKEKEGRYKRKRKEHEGMMEIRITDIKWKKETWRNEENRNNEKIKEERKIKARRKQLERLGPTNKQTNKTKLKKFKEVKKKAEKR